MTGYSSKRFSEKVLRHKSIFETITPLKIASIHLGTSGHIP